MSITELIQKTQTASEVFAMVDTMSGENAGSTQFTTPDGNGSTS